MLSGGIELPAADSGHIEHLAGGDKNRVAVIFVRQVNDFFYAYLDYQLGAFVAGKKGDIHSGAIEVRFV